MHKYIGFIILSLLIMACDDNSDVAIDPTFEPLSTNCVAVGDRISLDGQNLETIDIIKIGDELIDVVASPTNISVLIPKQLASGEYEVVAISTERDKEITLDQELKITGFGNWSIMNSNFPGTLRNTSNSFVIGNYLYYGGGSDSNFNRFYDFWKLNLFTSQWTQLSNFDLNNNVVISSVSNSQFGFIVTSSGEFFKYDPESDNWISLAQFPISGGFFTLTFFESQIHLISYDQFDQVNELWSYNEEVNSWDFKHTINANLGQFPVIYILDDLMFAGFGVNTNELFKYNTENKSFELFLDLDFENFGLEASSNQTGFIGLALNRANSGSIPRTKSVYEITSNCDRAFIKSDVPLPAVLGYTSFTFQNNLHVGLGAGTTNIWVLEDN